MKGPVLGSLLLLYGGFHKRGAPIWRSLHEGSNHFGFILGAHDFWNHPNSCEAQYSLNLHIWSLNPVAAPWHRTVAA